MKQKNNKNHGGARPGAGRPKGLGPYGESTRPLRIPISMYEEVKGMIAARGYRIPHFSGKVPAGHPVEAQPDVEGYMTPEDILALKQGDYFILTVKGDSMIKVGIFNGDYLLVDQARSASNGDIVVASINNEATVKRLCQQNGTIRLLPENDTYQPIVVPQDADFRICGVVIRSIRRF